MREHTHTEHVESYNSSIISTKWPLMDLHVCSIHAHTHTLKSAHIIQKLRFKPGVYIYLKAQTPSIEDISGDVL